MATQEVLRTPFTRVFLTEDGASPNNPPRYLGVGRAGGLDWGQGTITPIRKPSPNAYGQFDTIDTARGAPDLPSLSIEARVGLTISDLLRVVKKGCAIDVQVHAGQCRQPDDFDGGFEIAWVLEGAIPSNYSTTELGALDADQDSPVTETVDLSGQNLYQIKKLRPSEMAAAAVTDVINRVLICDSQTCGDCGISSDGCQVMFLLAAASTGSPGLPTEVLYSVNGGATWASTNITTLSVAENASDMACVGTNLVAVSPDSNSLHYAAIADILTGTETWQEVATGFVTSNTPNKIFSLDRTNTWIVADNGYIYYSDDVTSGVEVQTDGSVSSENLQDVHAIDNQNIVAVGDNNVVLVSSNGGASWTLATGPAVGVGLTAVFMQDANRWLVGTAGGELYFTINAGGDWTEKTFPGSGTGTVRGITFPTRNIGYMVHDGGSGGRLLRTYSGGNTWIVAPEEAGISVPTTSSLRSVAACQDDVNIAIVGGTASGGTDGYAAKYA